MFVSTSWTAGAGITDADSHCQADAADAGLAGTFKALLSTGTATAASRFTPAHWYRLDGVDVGDLTSDSALGPPLLNISGAYGTPTYVMTGSTSPQIALPPSPYNCVDWTDAGTGLLTYVGNETYASSIYFYQYLTACTGSVYCLEQ